MIYRTKEVEDDFDDIAAYIARDSIDAALKWIEKIDGVEIVRVIHGNRRWMRAYRRGE